MGGRGASGTAKIPSSGMRNVKVKIKMNNPANIPSNAITLEEFYRLRGVGYATSGVGIDRYAGANMTRMSDKQRKKAFEEINKENDKYYQTREDARKEYQSLIDKGVIRDKTPIEKTITAAHGNPDLKATQAARRMCEKRGINWRTGKKLKKK